MGRMGGRTAARLSVTETRLLYVIHLHLQELLSLDNIHSIFFFFGIMYYCSMSNFKVGWLR